MVTIQAIVQEVLGIQNCVTPLLNRGDQLMSWKYPGTLASQVVIPDALVTLSKDNSQAQIQGLELLVDRLVLVFQLSICVLDKKNYGTQCVENGSSISTIVETFLHVLNQQYTSSQGTTQQGNLDMTPAVDREEAQSAEGNLADPTGISSNGPKLRDRNTLRNPVQHSTETVINGDVKFDRRKPCPTCGLRAQRAKKSTIHTCTICQKEFRLRKYLTLHLKTEHKEDSEEKETEEGDDDVDEEVESLGAIGMEEHECEMCDLKFLEARNLRRHVRSKHKVRETVLKKAKVKKIEPEDDGRFKCPECGKLFKTERILQKHSQIHTGNYTYNCDVCGKGYYNIGSYRAHLSTHTGEKYFVCKQCGKGFPHSSSYNFHIRTAHTTEQNFECEVCNRKYKSEKYLKDHIQSVHMQPDRYNCSVCGRTFGHRASLFMHMKTHRKDPEPKRAETIKQPEETPPASSDVVAVAPARDDRPLYKQLRSYVEPENVNQGLINSQSITVTQLPTDVNYQQQQQNFVNCNFANSEPIKELANGASSDGANMHLLMPQQPQDKFMPQAASSVSYSAPPSSCVYPAFTWGSREREFAFPPNGTGIGRSLPPVSLPPIVSTIGTAANNTLSLPSLPSLPSQYGYTTGTMQSATVLPNIYPPIAPQETSSVPDTNPSTG